MIKQDASVIYPSDIIKEDRYPSLNGLRGISIIMVVVSHLYIFEHLNTLGGSAYIIFNGGLGVNIFFVLSGFLITSLCIKEISVTGGLNLKKFYIRRALRIFPVAYCFLIVLVLLKIIYHLDFKWFQIAGAGLYIMNFKYFRSHDYAWLTGHYWSLSVEEQFYIIFPFLLKQSKKAFFITITCIVFLLPLLCTLQFIFPSLDQGIFYLFTHYFIKFQAIATGCLFSVLTFNKVFDNQYFVKTKILGNIVAIFLIFYLKYDEFYSLKTIYLNSLIAILTAYIIVSNLTPANDFIFKLLNFKALAFIGILSYSIYIWQQLFVSEDPNLSKYVVGYPYNIIWIMVVPCISYYFYERYFLNLKKHFKIV